MTKKAFVLSVIPDAVLAHITNYEFEIVRPTRKGEKPTNGWEAHVALGRGTNPRRAWANASTHRELSREMPPNIGGTEQ